MAEDRNCGTHFLFSQKGKNVAPQKIQLELVYYNHKSDVPAATLSTMTNYLFNTLNDLLISKGPSARPPLIVIVRSN